MKKIIVSIIAILFVILCFVFNKYDLSISIYLSKFDNGFYELFDDYGELPIYIGPIIFGAIYARITDKKKYRFLFSMITVIAYTIASMKVIHNIEIEFNVVSVLVGLVIALIMAVSTLLLFYKINIGNLNKIKDLALLGLIVSLASYGSTEIIKYTWGRVRFRDLSSDYSEFTNLFKINWFTGHKSFPSGHTNAATSILLLSLIIERLATRKIIKKLSVIMCFIYIFMVAFSRIVVSAHYASDVLVGFAVGVTTLNITYSILKRKGVINASNS